MTNRTTSDAGRRWQPAEIEGLDALLEALNAGETIIGESPHHQAMHAASQEALRLAAEINGTYHSPEEVVELMSALTCQAVPESFRMFPPSPPTSAETPVSASGSSSTADAVSRTRAGLTSETALWWARDPSSPRTWHQKR